MNQPGLLTNIRSDPMKNKINVCQQECKISEEDSSSTQTSCTLAGLPTLYSALNFNISQSKYIIGTHFASNSTYLNSVWDGDLQNGFNDSNRYCFFGTEFRPGYVGYVSEVSYFMTRFARSNFVGKLIFQGSMDGKTYTNIFTVG